jgi:hypothetical protein
MGGNEQVAGPFHVKGGGVGTRNDFGTSGLGSMYGPTIADGPQPGTPAYYQQRAEARKERQRQVLAEALRVTEEEES